jgi:hypothetical protein
VLDATVAFASNDAKDSTGQKRPGWNGERRLTGLECNPKDD